MRKRVLYITFSHNNLITLKTKCFRYFGIFRIICIYETYVLGDIVKANLMEAHLNSLQFVFVGIHSKRHNIDLCLTKYKRS